MDPLQKKPYVKAGHEGKLDRGRGLSSGQGRKRRRRRRRKRASGSLQLNEASEKPSKPSRRSGQQLRILNTNSEMFTHPRAAPGTHARRSMRASMLQGRNFRISVSVFYYSSGILIKVWIIVILIHQTNCTHICRILTLPWFVPSPLPKISR